MGTKLLTAAALAAATALAAPAIAAEHQTDAAAGAEATMQTDTEAAAGMEGEAAGTLGENLTEDEVRRVQQALADAGQDIEVTGQWDDETAEALRAFQEAEGLTPSGELDERTTASLGVDVGETDAQQAERPMGEGGAGMDGEAGAGEQEYGDEPATGTTAQ